MQPVRLSAASEPTAAAAPLADRKVRPTSEPINLLSSCALQLPPLYQWLQKAGNIPTDDLRRTFNCGVGMIIVVDPSQVRSSAFNLTMLRYSVSAEKNMDTMQ